MGGSSSQVVGYKYYAGLMVALGNTVEQLININPDKRGWIFTHPNEINQLKSGDTTMVVNKPDLFGGDKQEGGWVGLVDIHTGRPGLSFRQNEYLALHDSELVSAFPCLSYLVYRGADIKHNPFNGQAIIQENLDKGFQLVSMSGMMKEVLYWVKRIHVKNNGDTQWYDEKSEIKTVLRQGGSKANPLYQGEALTRASVIDGTGGITGTDEMSWVFTGGNPDSPFFVQVGSSVYRQYAPYDGDFPHDSVSTSLTCTINSKGKVRISGRYSTRSESSTISAIEDSDLISLTIAELSTGEPTIRAYNYTAWFDLTSKDKFGLVLYATGVVDVGSFREIEIGSSYAYFYGPYDIGDKYDENGLDINPIHKIREILTDDTAMNKPESLVNDENFTDAADRIFDEGLGISWAIQEKTCKEAIDELLYHIEAGIRVNRQTGKYEVVLFRDDLLNLNDALVFDKTNIKSFNIEIANIDDIVNSVNINYYDRYEIKNSSFSLDDIGGVLSSELNAQTLDFPYFMSRRNAELVGNWKLKQLSTPTRRGSFTTGKYDARKINRYDVVKLTWPNQNMLEIPVRIMKIGLGDGVDNTVTLDWIEVIPYSGISYPIINVDNSTNSVLSPQQNQSVVFEMPYFEAVQQFGQTQVDAELANNPDLGYLMVATKRPQNNSINALLYTNSGTGYEQTSLVNYCPTATIDQNIGYLDTSFALKNVNSISQAEIGTLILCNGELMVYQAYNATTKVLTVKRAALDTVPKQHAANSAIYFYDAFNAFDPEQYVLSEVINAKVLTTTPSGIQDIAEVPAMSLEINARPIRPYPPANVKINDEYHPDEIDSDLIVTWVDRNRLQQTGGSILGWTDGGVALESGAATMLIIKELNSSNVVVATHNIDVTSVNSHTLPISSLHNDAKYLNIIVKTVRDGYDSYQFFDRTVELAIYFSAPHDITYNVSRS